MAKRKEPDTPSKILSTPSKRVKKDTESLRSPQDASRDIARASKTTGPHEVLTPRKRGRNLTEDEAEDTELTPRANGNATLETPRRKGRPPKATPSQSAKADRSAKRKSAQTLVDVNEEEDWDNSAAIAKDILADDEVVDATEGDTAAIDVQSTPVTPSRRGRPKGAKNKRSPTPEGDLAPEERYFFQNRAGPSKISSNIFTSLGLLNHDEYFECLRKYEDDHALEKAYLMKLHARSFPQWMFELDRGFGVCMYGYGSKRKLVNRFAEWLYPKLGDHPRIVVLNGYTSKINMRNVLSTIGSALVNNNEELKMTGQPHEMVDTLLSHLTHHVDGKLNLMINSIDSPSLRKTTIQSIFARLAAHPKVNFLATADTPIFSTMWNSSLKDQFRFVFHDCTTFDPYELETNPVDDVNELLGRKNRRMGGTEGVGFVLKSLPENARNLYRVLLTEILTIVNDGMDELGDEDEGNRSAHRGAGEAAEEVGVEYRTLYQKALEEFICSSDINFRFLLKEFHDHQMLTSKRDTSGTELLSVPLSREEMEAVLEDLVIG